MRKYKVNDTVAFVYGGGGGHACFGIIKEFTSKYEGYYTDCYFVHDGKIDHVGGIMIDPKDKTVRKYNGQIKDVEKFLKNDLIKFRKNIISSPAITIRFDAKGMCYTDIMMTDKCIRNAIKKSLGRKIIGEPEINIRQ